FAGGWKSSNRSELPVEGEIFFLTFPFIGQAISPTTFLWGIADIPAIKLTDTPRCKGPNDEIMVWDQNRRPWIDISTGATYPPGQMVARETKLPYATQSLNPSNACSLLVYNLRILSTSVIFKTALTCPSAPAIRSSP